MSSPRSSRTNLTKRACDGCKIRKVKCDGNQPCRSCAKAEIACTFLRTVNVRGPRRMREATRHIIERSQRDERRQSSVDDEDISQGNGSAKDSGDIASNRQGIWNRIPVGTLAPQLYIYHVRMFPIWPVVNVDDLIAELQQEDQDGHDKLEAYALATSVVAATIAQLRLEQQIESSDSRMPRGSDMVHECEKARSLIGYRGRINLNTIRISFFLHIYYENQQPGSGESLLHLRESISIAQLMSLHQETSYIGRAVEEQNLRRWILWLLFVTERGVCLLHKLPVIIKTNIALPSINSHDESSVLPAFIQLINLFWTFEQSGLFDVLRDRDNTDLPSVVGAVASIDSQTVEELHRKLHEAAKDLDSVTDVQKVDIYVTRHWMKMILWKLRSPSFSPSNAMSVAFPLNAALDFLNTISRLPASAIEAHGLTIQLKIVEIASSVVDSISHLATLSITLPTWTNDLSPSRILTRLHLLMSSFRHNAACKSLVDMLYQKTTEAYTRTGYCPPLSSRSILGQCSSSDHYRSAQDGDGDHTIEAGQNSLFSPLIGNDLSLDSVLVLGSADELPYDHSDHYRHDVISAEDDSPETSATVIFDQPIDQHNLYPSQQRPGFTSASSSSLLMHNNEDVFFISAPFVPNIHERSNETSSEMLF